MDEKQMTRLLKKSWLGAEETVRFALGGEETRGHVGAAIGDRCFVPLPPIEGAPQFDSDVSMPSLTNVVREGRFRGDEWVHDPAMRAWAEATREDQIAVVCAGYLSAAGADGWYVRTDQRLAVVVPSAAIKARDDEGQDPQGEAPSEQDSEGGFGRLLGRARSVVSAVSDVAESVTGSGSAVTTLWETTVDRTTGSLVTAGRHIRGFTFSEKRFEDGSVLHVRARKERLR